MLARYPHVVPQDQRTAVDRTVEVFLRRSAANSDGKSLRINQTVGVPDGIETDQQPNNWTKGKPGI